MTSLPHAFCKWVVMRNYCSGLKKLVNKEVKSVQLTILTILPKINEKICSLCLMLSLDHYAAKVSDVGKDCQLKQEQFNYILPK